MPAGIQRVRQLLIAFVDIVRQIAIAGSENVVFTGRFKHLFAQNEFVCGGDVEYFRWFVAVHDGPFLSLLSFTWPHAFTCVV